MENCKSEGTVLADNDEKNIYLIGGNLQPDVTTFEIICECKNKLMEVNGTVEIFDSVEEITFNCKSCGGKLVYLPPFETRYLPKDD